MSRKMTEGDILSPESEPAKVAGSKGKEKREKSKPLTKIVCRRLPPTMTEESFLEQVSPIPEHDYLYFAAPDPTLAPNLFSRVYINFVHVEDVFSFRDRFDDYIFLDEKGNEFPAVVEYAPFQRIPKKRRKKDPKCGTIESDPIYLEFLESLKETDSDSREPKMEYSYQLTEEKKETTTPLLEFLAVRRREERRRREDRQRRRPRNRNSKDEEIFDEDFKKIKPRDNDKEKPPSKKRDEDITAGKNDAATMDSKDLKAANKTGSKSYKEQRKAADEHRKKNDFDKKETFKSKEFDSGVTEPDKSNRTNRKDKVREYSKDKFKDVKKYSDVKKEKNKFNEKKGDKLPSYKQLDESAQDKKYFTNTDGKNETAEKTSNVTKSTLLSSKITPFTQLPKYTAEDLSKVIEELDKNVSKLKLEKSEINPDPLKESGNSSENKNNDKGAKRTIVPKRKESSVNIPDVNIEKKVNASKEENSSLKCQEKEEKSSNNEENVPPDNDTTDENGMQLRRSSLESMEVRGGADDAPLRRHKSLDDKTQDSKNHQTKDCQGPQKNIDTRKERRIRNKDRPSIAIYQPGMGRFSKQRLDREKDTNDSSPPIGVSNSISTTQIIEE